MKLSNLKIGDTITHYCHGQLVTGKIIETGTKVMSQHEPVRWGEIYSTQTCIHQATPLQRNWGGRDKDRNPCRGIDTTPAAFYNGKPITI